MEKRKDSLSQQLESDRSKIINSYLTTIEDSFLKNCSQLKLINYGTGSGKTHLWFQAVYKTIEEHSNIQTTGIYVAPLREHLYVPTSVASQYPDIPVYKLNSVPMKTTDEFIKLYKKWIPSILRNKDIWNINVKEYPREKVEKVKQNLKKVTDVINRLEFVKKIELGDQEFKEYQIEKAEQELNKLIENFLEFLVKCKPN